jgi:type II secretory pathway pseudopilin PulG
MTRQSVRRQHNDSGAALLLAIGFVLMISAISAGLASLATSSLNNRATLELVRNRQYAADGAIQQAISQVRGLTCASTNGYTEDTLNAIAIRVDWVTDCSRTVPSSDGTAYPQRDVIFGACLKPLAPAACGPTDVIIRAQVNFEPQSGPVTKTFIQTWSVNR